MTTTKVSQFEVVDHGIEHEQYFQGCGVALTPYDHCATGCGSDPLEALDDALEQIACDGDILDVEDLEHRIELEHPDFWDADKVYAKRVKSYRQDECHYYVSIRYSISE